MSYEYHFVWVYLPATMSFFQSNHHILILGFGSLVQTSFELQVMIMYTFPTKKHKGQDSAETTWSPKWTPLFQRAVPWESNGKTLFLIGNTSSNSGFSSAGSSWFIMLVEVVGTIRMGSFMVDVPGFEKVALPTLQKAPHVDVYIIDEVPWWFPRQPWVILVSFHRYRHVSSYGGLKLDTAKPFITNGRIKQFSYHPRMVYLYLHLTKKNESFM